jgi:hypothetical protein
VRFYLATQPLFLFLVLHLVPLIVCGRWALRAAPALIVPPLLMRSGHKVLAYQKAKGCPSCCLLQLHMHMLLAAFSPLASPFASLAYAQRA